MSSPDASREVLHIAVEGCTHGELDLIYSRIAAREAAGGYKVDLLICCGDFQSNRDMVDLQCMSCPNKYKAMLDFWKYYHGVKTAPILTVFIGGNHEATNHNLELYFGGWAAPNIYFLGHSGCVVYRGLRICGVSGIYKPYDIDIGYPERLPFSKSALRSIYHHRTFEMKKLAALSFEGREKVALGTGRIVDVCCSHDWPTNVWRGAMESVRHLRPQLRAAILAMSGSQDQQDQPHHGRGRRHHGGHGGGGRRNRRGSSGEEEVVGSPPMTKFLLQGLKPFHFFSGHMHQKLECVYRHQKHDHVGAEEVRGEEEEEEGELQTTRFLALSKPIAEKDDFLDVVPIEVPAGEAVDQRYAPNELYYDKEWLAILKASHPFMSINRRFPRPFPKKAPFRDLVDRQIAFVERRMGEFDDGKYSTLRIPRENFVKNPGKEYEGDGTFFVTHQPTSLENPQRTEFCRFLEISDIVGQMASGRDRHQERDGRRNRKRNRRGRDRQRSSNRDRRRKN